MASSEGSENVIRMVMTCFDWRHLMSTLWKVVVRVPSRPARGALGWPRVKERERIGS